MVILWHPLLEPKSVIVAYVSIIIASNAMSQNISNLRINFLCCSRKDALMLPVVIGKPGAHSVSEP